MCLALSAKVTLLPHGRERGQDCHRGISDSAMQSSTVLLKFQKPKKGSELELVRKASNGSQAFEHVWQVHFVAGFTLRHKDYLRARDE